MSRIAAFTDAEQIWHATFHHACPDLAQSPPLPEWGPRGGGARGRSSGGKWRGVDPVVPFTDPEQIASIRDFYGLDERLKLEDQLVTRSFADTGKPKRLYFISTGP
jgi:multisite-specific tRNA:(cytosine-C5)-methyltransferase